MREYIGQQLIIGLAGEELSKEESHFIIENNIGGVVLFDRNLKSVEQTHTLINEIQKLRYKTTNKTPLFISIDMEGGRVHVLGTRRLGVSVMPEINMYYLDYNTISDLVHCYL